MKNKFALMVGCITLCGFAAAANATTARGTFDGTIYLQPSAGETAGTLLIDLYMDFSSDPTLGGGVDLFYDPNVVSFASWTFNSAFIDPSVSDPAFTRAPDDCASNPSATGCGGPGEANGLGFGSFNGIGGPWLVGQFAFDIIGGGPGDVTSFTLAINDSPAGPFFSLGTSSAQNVELIGADIQVKPIPLPAAAWLLLGGIGALGGMARRRS